MSNDTQKGFPAPQLVRWKPRMESGPGILIETENGRLIEWEAIKLDIERWLLPETPNMPSGCTAHTADHGDKRDFVVRVKSPGGDIVGSVWFGSDPYKDWEHDGFIRVGRSVHAGAPEPEVWLVAVRMSDGTYRILQKYE